MTLSDMENWSLGVTRSNRDLPPGHFTLKIKSYSLLAKTEVQKYDSGVFEAPGGHKWRLSLHPNEGKEVTGYISLYLEIAETDKYPQGWEVYVNYKLFVLDHLQNKYLTIQDADEDLKRFHAGQTAWGFAKLPPLETFKNSSNGYLVNDCCEFGAEVFVYQKNSEWESLDMVKPNQGTLSYKLEKFSTLKEPSYLSKVFTVGERNWRIGIYPNGTNNHKGKSLSVFLQLVDWKSLPTKRAIFAKFKIRVLDQVSDKHVESTVEYWFSTLDATNGRGRENLMSLENLHNASKGFIKNDALVVEVEILTVSVIKAYA